MHQERNFHLSHPPIELLLSLSDIFAIDFVQATVGFTWVASGLAFLILP